MKPRLIKVYNYLEENIVVIIASLAIFFSPFVVDYNDLPKGYELPKVHFLIALAALIIIVTLVKYISVVYKKGKFIFSKDFIVFLAVVIIFILAALVSPHFQTAIFGNSFRDQGLIAHLLLIGMAYSVYKSVNHKNFHIIALSFISSATIQAVLGYSQALNLAQTDPQALLDGLWVNGTFGQANFFSGRLLMALIFLAYYIAKSLKIKFASLTKLVFILCALIITGSLLLSLSIWAIVVAAVAFITIVIYEVIPQKFFSYLFYILVILASLFGGVYLYTSTIYNIRTDIWKHILTIMFSKFNLNTLFGYGFDTLGEVFKDNKFFSGLLIDRAHNFFFDILFQTGVLGLGITLGILLKPVVVLRAKIKDRKFMFFFFAMFFWVLRSFVHESGIVNLADFLIILAGTLALCKYTKVEAEVELNIDVSKLEIPKEEITETPSEEPAM